MSEQPLWSERRGATLPLTESGFSTLILSAIEKVKAEKLLAEAFGYEGMFGAWQKGVYDQTDYLTWRLGDPWADRLLQDQLFADVPTRDDLLDLIELLYRELVSMPDSPRFIESFDKAAGQRRLIDIVNPILARTDPPLELRDTGEIVEAVAEPFQRLVHQPLPDDVPKKEVAERVDDAVRHYLRRNATIGDRRAAVKELIDVLEFMRDDVKEHMLTKDEAAMFQLANGFTIRHNKPHTRRDYDEAAWLAWTFYLYLASIRLVIELKRRAIEEPPAQ